MYVAYLDLTCSVVIFFKFPFSASSFFIFLRLVCKPKCYLSCVTANRTRLFFLCFFFLRFLFNLLVYVSTFIFTFFTFCPSSVRWTFICISSCYMFLFYFFIFYIFLFLFFLLLWFYFKFIDISFDLKLFCLVLFWIII